MAITDEKELGEAFKNNPDEIVIEGNVADKVFKIKAKGRVAWAVAIGAIAVAVAIIITTGVPTGGAGVVAGLVPLAPAVGILGAPAAVSCALMPLPAGVSAC